MIFLILGLMWLESDQNLINDLGNPNYRVREQATCKIDFRLSMSDGFDDKLYELLRDNRNHPNLEVRHRIHKLIWKYRERFFSSSNYFKVTFDHSPFLTSGRLEELKCEEISIMTYYDYEISKRLWVVVFRKIEGFGRDSYEKIITTIPNVVAVDVLPDYELPLWRQY